MPDVAPSLVQQRTMSRMESTPTRPGSSATTRWRMLRRVISAAARSRLQSGPAAITEADTGSRTNSASGAAPAAPARWRGVAPRRRAGAGACEAPVGTCGDHRVGHVISDQLRVGVLALADRVEYV